MSSCVKLKTDLSQSHLYLGLRLNAKNHRHLICKIYFITKYRAFTAPQSIISINSIRYRERIKGLRRYLGTYCVCATDRGNNIVRRASYCYGYVQKITIKSMSILRSRLKVYFNLYTIRHITSQSYITSCFVAPSIVTVSKSQ